MADEQGPEDLLQSALSSAFTPVSIAPAPPDSSSAPQLSSKGTGTGAPEASASASASLVTQEELDKHEQERLALERSWKEESAVQRREAEERRARIAAERVASGKTWESETGGGIRGPPNVSVITKGYPGEPSVADVRDVVSGEPTGTRHATTSTQVSPGTTATLEHSQRWEEIESLESSYPSLSFPEQSQSDSAPSSEHDPHTHSKSASYSYSKSKSSKHVHSKEQSASEKQSTSAQGGKGTTAEPLPSATLSIFDTRLSTRARLIALVSALSINLFLPFVNGVMLGFGEIFARNMASRFFGWTIPGQSEDESKTPTRTPGGAATAVGVRASPAGGIESRRRRSGSEL